MITKKTIAELLGTFLLVLVGCGSAIIAGPQIGNLGVALSFGLTLAVLAYTLGPISGCHINPAVTLTMLLTKRIKLSEAIYYIAMQLVGGILAGYVLYYIAQGNESFALSKGFALNGYGEHSPQNYSMISCLLVEAICTFLLLFVVLSTTKVSFPTQMIGLVLGLTLIVIHLLSIPVTNTSVNFARSLATAVVYKSWALCELWLFAVAHIIAVISAVSVNKLISNK